ncbi:MAG: V4R domain-containing protein [Candidatus Jordarchaeales archaeon]
MLEEVPVRVLFFKSKSCAFCAPVERMVRKAISRLFGDELITVNVFDVDEHNELVDEYKITSLPYVIVGEVPVISGMASEKEIEDALMRGILHSASSRAERIEVGAKQVFIEANLNFVESINSKERIRRNIGDYVHISNLQLATISLLSLDTTAGNLLYSIGKLAGKTGAFTGLLYDIEPSLGDPYASVEKNFRSFLIAIDRFHVKQNELGVFDARNAEVVEEDKGYGRIRIYESATATGVPVIGEPICYFTAGMISGLAEAILGETVYVAERNCWGLGASYCEFEISLSEGALEGKKTTPHLTKKGVEAREESFGRLIRTLTRNMTQSVLEGRRIRVGISDYTHIMNLQQQITSIKLADPVAGFFLRLAGKRLGRIIAPKEHLSVNEAIFELKNYMNSPLSLMSGIHSNCNIKKGDGESFIVTVESCAFASGQENIGVSLCKFEAGVIEGFMEKSTGKSYSSKEVECWGLGQQHCAFQVEREKFS